MAFGRLLQRNPPVWSEGANTLNRNVGQASLVLLGADYGRQFTG